jgi:malic enzyme
MPSGSQSARENERSGGRGRQAGSAGCGIVKILKAIGIADVVVADSQGVLSKERGRRRQ